MNNQPHDDRIFQTTRVILGVIVPILLAAFILLYLFPQTTGQTFAWQINPPLTAMIMGAGYVGGSYQFVYAIFGRKWHRVANSFLPVTSFTIFMLLATLLHLDRFIQSHVTFYIWLIVYLITPFVVPWMWFRNRVTDPHIPEENDVIVPRAIRILFGFVGAVGFLFWLFMFIDPQAMISIWPWKLTPLTARVLCGWGSLLGIGGLVLYFEPRWSAWRYGFQSIGVWQALVVLASIIRRQDYTSGSLMNFYFIAVALLLVVIIVIYAGFEGMRIRRKQKPIPVVKPAP